jgi:hypothetical protein
LIEGGVMIAKERMIMGERRAMISKGKIVTMRKG